MANTLVSLSGFQRGIEAAETGINIESFTCRYYLQFKDKLNDYLGQIRGFAIPDKFSREVRIAGEVSSIGSLSGVMIVVCNAAFTPGNDVGTFIAVTSGSNAGGLYLDEVTESQTRDGFRSVEATFTSDPGVT